MPVYNHAFDMGFSIDTSFPADHFNKIPPHELRKAIQRRLESISDGELHEALGGPFDTYEQGSDSGKPFTIESRDGSMTPKRTGATHPSFQIDVTASDDEYLYVNIPSRCATVVVKIEAEGVVADIWPLNCNNEPADSAHALTSDLCPGEDDTAPS